MESVESDVFEVSDGIADLVVPLNVAVEGVELANEVDGVLLPNGTYGVFPAAIICDDTRLFKAAAHCRPCWNLMKQA